MVFREGFQGEISPMVFLIRREAPDFFKRYFPHYDNDFTLLNLQKLVSNAYLVVFFLSRNSKNTVVALASVDFSHDPNHWIFPKRKWSTGFFSNDF